MLRIEMLPAQQGDTLWIEYGDPAKPRRVLIDGGTRSTWSTKTRPGPLAQRIAALPEDEREFELLVVTHVDGDHILGAVQLLADETLGAKIEDVWFNGFRHLPGTTEPMGPVDGEELTFLLDRRTWNDAFRGRAIEIPERGKLPSKTLTGGLKLTLVAPDEQRLADMVPVWQKAVTDAGLVPGKGAKPTPVAPPGLEPLGSGAIPDVEQLATARVSEDTAEANGTSIVLLAEHDGASALLCADAFPTVVLQGVKRLIDERGGERLEVDALKLPHHGSRRNCHLELLAAIDSREFLFSSNGNRTKHPDMEPVAQVIHTYDDARLWFNYKTAFNEVWDGDAAKDRFGYRAVYGDGTVAVELE
jgi:beta-lactamase superfamily II metal-dependent hydrolase